MLQHMAFAQQCIDQHKHLFDGAGQSEFMTQQAAQSGGTIYSSRQLIAAVLFAWHLRDSGGLKEALPSAIEHVLPGWLSNTVLSTGRHVCPSRSMMRSSQLCVDIALMLSRREGVSEPAVRYGWADSSTGAQGDWLICKHQVVLSCDIESACRASQELVSELRLDGAGRRRTLSRELFDVVRILTQPPMSMASGVTSLQHKVSVLAYAFYLETGSLKDLAGFLDSFVSFTTDMGTELGAASFLLTDIKDLLPDWLRNPWMNVDVDAGEHQVLCIWVRVGSSFREDEFGFGDPSTLQHWVSSRA